MASDVDETLPLENPGEAIQAAKAAADSLEVPDTQPRPDLDDIFSDAMPNETWLPKDEPDVGKESKAWFDPKTKISADPGLRQGRGGAWDHRRCGSCLS